MNEAKRQVLVIYSFANLALIFSLALPAAGMINHLINRGTPSFGRGIVLWLALSLLGVLITLPFVRLIYGKIKRRF